jgi:hypothetical protein
VHSVTQSVQSAATELLQTDPPPGFFAATAEAASRAPTLGEIRRGSYSTDGWAGTPRKVSLASSVRRPRRQSTDPKERPALETGDSGGLIPFPALTEETTRVSREHEDVTEASVPSSDGQQELAVAKRRQSGLVVPQERTDHGRIHRLAKDRRAYSSGYIPPPVIPWTTSTWIALKAFWKWFLTPFGFLVTIYGLNVVAWGGMLFLLLCNASQAMCWAPLQIPATEGQRSPAASLALNDGRYPRYHNCNAINSPRRIWIEIDSQILNALFCVTGFGLIPWRFRDLYYLLLWRFTSEKKHGTARKLYGLRVLAGVYNTWFRLPGSQTLDTMTAAEYIRTSTKSAHTPHISPSTDLESGPSSSPESDPRLPIPVSKRPDEPLTEIRAPPTALWKLDFFVWSQVGNTLFQVVLCGFMWGMTRYNRPAWATGLFIALGCIIAGLGGLVSFLEGRKVKRVEGVRPTHGMEDEEGLQLKETRTGRESLHVGEKGGVGARRGV